jgi:hypothetical protein
MACKRAVLKEKIPLGNFKSCPNHPEKKRTYEHVLNHNTKVFGGGVARPSSHALLTHNAERSWNLVSVAYSDVPLQLHQKAVRGGIFPTPILSARSLCKINKLLSTFVPNKT